MPVGILLVASIFGAIGAVIGGFVVVNAISIMFTGGDRALSDFLNKIGTTEFKRSIATSPQKKKTVAAVKKEAKAAPAEGAAAAPVGDAHAAAHAAAAKPADGGHQNDTSLAKVAKVWIEPGCIVCDACVNTCPEVFKIEGETCIVLPNSDLSKVQEIKDAAAGCPVEVIKYS